MAGGRGRRRRGRAGSVHRRRRQPLGAAPVRLRGLHAGRSEPGVLARGLGPAGSDRRAPRGALVRDRPQPAPLRRLHGPRPGSRSCWSGSPPPRASRPTATSAWSRGESATVGDYEVTYDGPLERSDPEHGASPSGVLDVREDGEPFAMLARRATTTRARTRWRARSGASSRARRPARSASARARRGLLDRLPARPLDARPRDRARPQPGAIAGATPPTRRASRSWRWPIRRSRPATRDPPPPTSA